MPRKKLTDDQQKLRELFVKHFALELIKNTEVKIIEVEQPLFASEVAVSTNMINNSITVEKLKPAENQMIKNFIPLQSVEIPIPRPVVRERPRAMPRAPYPRAPRPQQMQPMQTMNVLPEGGLSNIVKFLNDPSVMGVECSGPGKPVIVNRSGRIESTSMVLTKENIDEIMEEVSKQTRIPIIPGVFKAVINNFIVTAVVSEFVGTRFAIQKRMPTGPPSPY